jgi:hypothetical protein
MKDAKTKRSPSELIPAFPVERCIWGIRGEKVILDADLAGLYVVTAKALTQVVKRNLARFPQDFAFLLTPEEKTEVVTNCDRLRRLKFPPVTPRAFTEHGAPAVAGEEGRRGWENSWVYVSARPLDRNSQVYSHNPMPQGQGLAEK